MAAKLQLAKLEKLDPMSQDFLDKLGHLEGAVGHHVFEEEDHWFPRMAEQASAADQAMVGQRYKEEFERYMGADAPAPAGGFGR